MRCVFEDILPAVIFLTMHSKASFFITGIKSVNDAALCLNHKKSGNFLLLV